MLNSLFLSRNRWSKAFIVLIVFGLATNLNCGKRKPPLPPLEKTNQRAEVSGIQKGNVIFLSFQLPVQNATEKNTNNIARADIYRLAEQVDAPLTLSAEEFASRSTQISSVEITAQDFRNGQATTTDILEFSGQKARLRYAIRFVNSSGQKAAFSNFLLIEPTAQTAQNPTDLRAATTEQAIKLVWRAPSENVDGTRPVNLIGYNLYRINENNVEKLLNNQPVLENNFDDAFFEFGKNYIYLVRAVSLGAGGEPIESADSNRLKVSPRDVFAPSPPEAITIAAAPNNLSIFFAVNPEKDIAGYRIYRSEDARKPQTEWELLNKELLTTNTFQDKNVKSGTTYYYYLAAVDITGNVSENSVVVSETTP